MARFSEVQIIPDVDFLGRMCLEVRFTRSGRGGNETKEGFICKIGFDQFPEFRSMMEQSEKKTEENKNDEQKEAILKKMRALPFAKLKELADAKEFLDDLPPATTT